MKKCITPECNNNALPDDEFGPRDHCGSCEDTMIERANEAAEWRYFHPSPSEDVL